MPFEKGQSGNPNGRPPGGLSLAARIRTLGGEDGATYAETLHSIATNENETTRMRIDAIKVLLDRGYGAPPQELPVETSHEIIQASALREVLRSEGMLNRTGQPQQSGSPRIQAWIDGDLDTYDHEHE